MENRLTVCASHLITLPSAPHGPVRAAISAAREAVLEFDPELVVFFGTDHRRAFRAVVPTFAVVLEASAQGDVAGPVGSYDVPADLGRALVADLVAGDFDIATAYRAELAYFFACLQAGASPEPGPRDALASLRVALAATKSLKEGRPVKVAEIE